MATVSDLYAQNFNGIDKASVVTVESQLVHCLEGLVDITSLEEVMQALSEMCSRKAEHVSENWQDRELAKAWATACGAIGVASTHKSIHRVS